MSETKKKKLFHRDFTLMVLGQIISLFGNAILRFSLALSVLDMTGSAAAFATISAISMIPTILLSPLGGALADRVSRKGIMAVLDFFTSALLIAFTFLFGAASSLVNIAVMLVLLSVIQSFYQPSVQSSIPLLAEEDQLMSANGIVVQVNALSGLLGPILGGFLYGIFGITPILYVSIVCFFLSAVMECFLHIPFRKLESKGGALRTIKSDFSDSFGFLIHRQRPLLKILFVAAGINLFLSAMLTVGLPYLVKIYLGLSSQLYGVAEGVMGVGSILGGLLAGLAAKRMKFSRAYVLLIASGAAVIPLAAAVFTDSAPMVSFGVILVSVAAMMCFATLFSVVGHTVIQKLTPTELLGKVMSVVTVISMCAFPLGQALYGLLFDWAKGYSYLVVLFAAVVCILLGLLSKGILRKMDLDEAQAAA